MTSPVLDWRDAYLAGPLICGGKGWNLARLHHDGFTIPRGFVLSAGVYRQIKQSSAEAWQQAALPEACLVAIERTLRELNLLDRPLAVRSSATVEDGASASFAGIHESYLNVRGMEQIEKAVLRCYASLWSERATSYRKKMQIDDKHIACAVVIQELIEAEAAGIAFTCDPATGRSDVITISANFGYGESVVSGAASFDEYTVRHHGQEIIALRRGKKDRQTRLSERGTQLITCASAEDRTVLSDEQIRRLARLALRVFHTLDQGEQHQDIEWVFDGTQFVLTQARPVTVLPRYTLPALTDQEEIWTAGNFKDAIPMVLPVMTRGFARFHIDNIMRHALDGTGYPIPEGINFGRLYQGRFYCNASLLQWLWFDAAGMEPALFNMSLGGHHGCIRIDDAQRGGVEKKIRRTWRSLQFLRYVNRHKAASERLFAQVKHDIDRWMAQDLTHLSDEALLALHREIDQQLTEYDVSFIALTSASGAIFVLIQILEKQFGGEAPAIANALLAGAATITSAEQGYRLYALAAQLEQDNDAKAWLLSDACKPTQWKTSLPDHSAFKKAFSDYLCEYGHRAAAEIDYSRPRWCEDPSYLLNTIKNYLGKTGLEKLRTKQKADCEAAWQRIKQHYSWPLRKFIALMAKRAADGAAVREQAKSHYVRYLMPLRKVSLEFGRRFAERQLNMQTEDIFHCDIAEIASIISGEWQGDALKVIIEERKAEQQRLQATPAPDEIVDNNPRFAYSSISVSHSDALKGVPVAGGCATGRAFVAHTPEQGIAMQVGDILIAPSTDPGWTPLFLHATGLVMETGGYLSHGAIVAREYGIPAVVNVAGAMSRISTGDNIKVDGNRGEVEVIK